MSLILPPWYFADETDNWTGTPSSEPGTAITPGTSNSDGSTVAALTAIAHDVHYLEVLLTGFNVSTAAHYCLLDIMIDPAGGSSWASTPLISDLVCGFTFPNISGGALWYHFPLYITSGASLGARARTSHSAAASSARVHMRVYGNPSRPEMWWCGSGVETLGVTAASSIGTSITPGNTGTYGSWTSIGSTSTARYGAVQCGFNGTDATSATLQYFFQIGYGSTKLPGSATMWTALGTLEAGLHSVQRGPIWCDIPSGTQMQMRGTCSGTAEVWAGGVAIYGVS